MKSKMFEGSVEKPDNLKGVHTAIVMEWDNGSIQVLWGGCMEKLVAKAKELSK